TVVVAYVRERNGHAANGAAMLDRARERLATAGLQAELAEREGEPDVELAELAKAADAVLVGRRGVTTKGGALGPTVGSLIRIAERCVIVCGGLPSPMTSCALAFDGRETSQRALELAVRLATVVASTIHLIHVLVHADESCLGNGTEPPNPGGNAALIEAPAGDSVARWDFYECSPDTTNNRMALAGAIATLEWLHRQWRSAHVTYVSDSEYL